MARLKVGVNKNGSVIIDSEELKKYPYASVNPVKVKPAIDANPNDPIQYSGKYKICFASSQAPDAQVIFSGEYDNVKDAEDFLITVLI